jgi:acetoin utilization protein AcuB
MLVKDLMTTKLVCIAPNRSVADASDIMVEHKIRHLPVVNDQGEPVGLITRATLARALPGVGTGLTRFEFSYLTSSTSVSEVMIKEPFTIDEAGAVEEAARIMNEQRISSLLVMHGKELVGIITDTDIFEALMELMGGRRSGVRLTVHIPDKAGALAAVTSAIAQAGGYLSAVGGWYVKGAEGVYGSLLKIENLTQEQVVEAISQLPEVKIVDVRGEEVMRAPAR